MLKTVRVSAFLLLASLSLINCETTSVEAPEVTEIKEPKYRFAPALGWMEALDFIKKEDVVLILKNMLNVYAIQFEEMKKVLDDKQSLSKEDSLKLKFLLSQVVSYR